MLDGLAIVQILYKNQVLVIAKGYVYVFKKLLRLWLDLLLNQANCLTFYWLIIASFYVYSLFSNISITIENTLQYLPLYRI